MVKSPAVPTEVILDQPKASQHSQMRELGRDVQPNTKVTTDACLSPAETRSPVQLTPRFMSINKRSRFQATKFWIVASIQQ